MESTIGKSWQGSSVEVVVFTVVRVVLHRQEAWGRSALDACDKSTQSIGSHAIMKASAPSAFCFFCSPFSPCLS